MCCLFAVLLTLGPRAGILVWWLIDQTRWEVAFDSFIWAFLGWLFLPWTTLMYVAVAPTGNIVGFDWVLLALAFVIDLGSYSGGGYTNRDRLGVYR